MDLAKKKNIGGKPGSYLDSCSCKFRCVNPVHLTEDPFPSLPPDTRVNISNDVTASSDHTFDFDYSVFIM
jgi:hypothetical protein